MSTEFEMQRQPATLSVILVTTKISASTE